MAVKSLKYRPLVSIKSAYKKAEKNSEKNFSLFKSESQHLRGSISALGWLVSDSSCLLAAVL